MLVNYIKSKIYFGKYEGKRYEEIVVVDPFYISWCLMNLDEFLISVDFIKEAVMINKDFMIPETYFPILDDKMHKTNEINENDFNNTFGLETDRFNSDYSYKNWLNLNLRPALIENELIRREEVEDKILQRREAQERYWEESENEKKSDTTDWTHYNEDLGWGEQSEDFWNQF